jgi:hypothetical protein
VTRLFGTNCRSCKRPLLIGTDDVAVCASCWAEAATGGSEVVADD